MPGMGVESSREVQIVLCWLLGIKKFDSVEIQREIVLKAAVSLAEKSRKYTFNPVSGEMVRKMLAAPEAKPPTVNSATKPQVKEPK